MLLIKSPKIWVLMRAITFCLRVLWKSCVTWHFWATNRKLTFSWKITPQGAIPPLNLSLSLSWHSTRGAGRKRPRDGRLHSCCAGSVSTNHSSADRIVVNSYNILSPDLYGIWFSGNVLVRSHGMVSASLAWNTPFPTWKGLTMRGPVFSNRIQIHVHIWGSCHLRIVFSLKWNENPYQWLSPRLVLLTHWNYCSRLLSHWYGSEPEKLSRFIRHLSDGLSIDDFH